MRAARITRRAGKRTNAKSVCCVNIARRDGTRALSSIPLLSVRNASRGKGGKRRAPRK